jgi:hypothetical protein
MASASEPKPPRNPDQDVPSRVGDDFPSPAKTPDETGPTNRDHDAPLPEEETYNASRPINVSPRTE